MNPALEGIKMGAMMHIGIAVWDVDKAADYYQRVFGIGPWNIYNMTFPELTYGDWVGRVTVRLGFAPVGDTQIELLTVLEGELPELDFIRTHGEGLHHLCFRVDDCDECVAQLEKQGIKIVVSTRVQNGRAIYVNSDPGGVMLELAGPSGVKASSA